ncbi:MAG: glycoside hydrolase family 38 N-terminal domain-containing protein [Anaerolineae bacterium]
MLLVQSIAPTLFLRHHNHRLEQLLRLTLHNDGSAANALLHIRLAGFPEQQQAIICPAGDSQHEVFIPDITQDCAAVFTLEVDSFQSSNYELVLHPQRKWVVHVVQLSHHDPGYTDLPSLVLREHDHMLDEAVDHAEATASFPDDARFRIVIEQAWSIDHYVKHMPADRVARIVELMRSGRFELTALFGNLTTELCGHETLARAAYHAFALKRQYGIPIVSAEHNDITGMSWGLSRVLTDAGIKLFCPGFPLYYNWSKELQMQSFWDQELIFGRQGPGAFWWESPAGKRVLLWCNNQGCGGPSHGSLPGIEEGLERYEEQGYPWPVMRWPVGGGARDNSPYIEAYAHKIKVWNETWAYPHLVCSTNARFYVDLARQDLSLLPVWRGELPGQDYPSGATSTAAATAANRNAHAALPAAEILASGATLNTDHPYPQDILSEGYEENLWHDEHAWGYHFPAGPAMCASQHEKELHAYRAEALAHSAANKAMARIADNLKLEEGYHLVVFNPTSWASTAPVHTPLRELDNSGSTMYAVPPDKDASGVGYLKGVLLTDRWHTVLPPEMVAGGFELIDVVTGKTVAFQIDELDSALEPLPYAAERLGIGSGTQRYGQFEVPLGLKRDLCFVAENIPALGYKAYRLTPAKKTLPAVVRTSGAGAIENEYYNIYVGSDGFFLCIYDYERKSFLEDSSCEHGFFSLVVRQPNAADTVTETCDSIEIIKSPIQSTIRIHSHTLGHPSICKTVRLFKGIKQVFLEMKVLKDSTPLLNAHIAFPFAAAAPRFRYEGALSVMDPIVDYLPGAYSDTIAVQSWVKGQDGGHSVLWSSLDAPIAGFGRLWPGYVSPAHRCIVDGRIVHPPQRPEDLDKGWIYSQLYNNNFGTNFSVSQCGEALFRYVLTSTEGNVPDAQAARFGWQAQSPLETILTDRGRPGNPLPPCCNLFEIDNPNVALLTLKRAEDERGYIARLWNLADADQVVHLTLTRAALVTANLTNLGEEDTTENLLSVGDSVVVGIAARDIVTVRIILEAG